MDVSGPGPVGSDLDSRACRAHDADAVTQAMLVLSRLVSLDPSSAYQTICEFAMVLCRAHAAGIALGAPAPACYRWIAACGRMRGLAGQELDAQIFERLAASSVPVLLAPRQPGTREKTPDGPLSVREALVCPFRPRTQFPGTLWVAVRDGELRFDHEDALVVQELSGFGAHCVDTLVELGHLPRMSATRSAGGGRSIT